MNRQRQYRQRSPTRESLEIEEQHFRMKELLRSDLSMLEQENAILKLKCKKVSELEEKVELVLKQNAQLLSQNQKMSRFLHQQKSENQILRNKCQTLANQKVSVMGENQQERRKLLKELQLLGDRVAEQEALKASQINQIRAQFQLELQNLKRQFHNSEDSYDMEIRKLRDQLDKREHEISEYANKLKRISTEADYEILKLKEQRQKYKNELVYCEADRVKQLEMLKSKFQSNYLEELQSIKRVHLNNLQEVQMENNRLKQSLDQRCCEIEGLVNKFNKQKIYFEDTINFLKRDCENYRNRVSETEQLGNLQINQMKSKLTSYHQAEIEQIRDKQQMQCKAYEGQISRLQNINHSKNIEIEQLIKDKVSTRNLFDSQIMRVKDEYSSIMQKYKDLQYKYNDFNTQANNRLVDKEKHTQYLENVIKTQKANSQSELQSLQKIIESLRKELANQKMIYRENQQNLKEEIANTKHQLNQFTSQTKLKENDYERLISQLKNELNGTSAQLNSKADSLFTKNRMIEKENQGLKNNITLKQKEIKNLVERLKASAERQSKLQSQIDELRNKMIKRQQKSNESINQQKNRLEASFNFAIQNLKSDSDAALRLQANRYKDLQQKLRRKEAELQQLLRMYKKMTDEIQVLTEQQANKKDITLKFPGATADLIATKNLFDVYLKTKVLDVCGDALKQNKTS